MQDVAGTLTAHARQHLVFHAAGLASQANSLILCAESGSGKSTLAAWLTASGFDYLSDELVAVTLDGTEMRGLARPIILREASAFVWHAWLDDSARAGLSRFPSGDYWLDPEVLRPCCVQMLAQPRLLLFPRYTPGRALTIEPLSPAKAVFHLMRRLINARNLPDWGFAGAAKLAGRCTAYSLNYGDVAHASAWIEEIVGIDAR
ncbi:MAG TPA: hypothetical protein VER55_11095 [Ardenticatenaceae bacterium]|nr:hypothetical protein [Ardenticatenaceae bacterium]